MSYRGEQHRDKTYKNMVCGLCKEAGHNKRTCPLTAIVHTSQALYASDVHTRPLITFVHTPAEPPLSRPTDLFPPPPPPPTNQRTKKPTKSEIKIQEILFEHCTEIPEGLYKRLMDALVI